MHSFYESVACKSRAHCRTCRDQSVIGVNWRLHISKNWEVDGGGNFVCPHGVEWGGVPTQTHSVTPSPVPMVEKERVFVSKSLSPDQAEKAIAATMASNAAVFKNGPKFPPPPPPTVHQPSGMVGYRGSPCSNLGESFGTEERKCCGGRVKLVEVFRCAAGVNNGRVSKDACFTCGFYRASS